MSDVARARGLLGDAERIVVLTGAGISTESGVPTFRGAGGLWRSHRPEDLATSRAFARDPRLVWEWYAWRRAADSVRGPDEDACKAQWWGRARWSTRRLRCRR